MTLTPEGIVRLDDRSRVSLGRYTNAEPGSLYKVEVTPTGDLLLTRIVQTIVINESETKK